MAAGLLALAFVAGRMTATTSLSETNGTANPVTVQESATQINDVPGDDIPGLPRFPGSTRVEYRQALVGDLLETEAEYVVAGDMDPVYGFYRQVFDDEGWTVADLGIYQGEWTFFVISGEREALVEIESRGTLIEVEIELSEPPTN
jgi:hypothetical protein